MYFSSFNFTAKVVDLTCLNMIIFRALNEIHRNS